MNGKFLGKITKADFGFNSDGKFGLELEFLFGGATSWGNSVAFTVPGNSANRRWEELGVMVEQVGDFLLEAKKSRVQDLVGTPVEVILEDNTLLEWRVLTEVL